MIDGASERVSLLAQFWPLIELVSLTNRFDAVVCFSIVRGLVSVNGRR